MAELLNLIKQIFVINRESYLVQKKKGDYKLVKKELTDIIINSSLNYQQTISTKPIFQISSGEYRCRYLVIDIDVRDKNLVTNIVDDFEEVFGVKRNYIFLEDSGNKGYHLYLFFSDVNGCDINVVKEIGIYFQNKYKVEYFPTSENSKYIRLPLSMNQKNNKQSFFITHNFEPVQNNIKYLKLLSETRLKLENISIPMLDTQSNEIPCLQQLFENEIWNDGERYQIFYGLVWFLKKFYQLNNGEIFDRITEWFNNCYKRNNITLEEQLKQLEATLKSDKLSFNCEDKAIYKSRCKPDKCSLTKYIPVVNPFCDLSPNEYKIYSKLKWFEFQGQRQGNSKYNGKTLFYFTISTLIGPHLSSTTVGKEISELKKKKIINEVPYKYVPEKLKKKYGHNALNWKPTWCTLNELKIFNNK